MAIYADRKFNKSYLVDGYNDKLLNWFLNSACIRRSFYAYGEEFRCFSFRTKLVIDAIKSFDFLFFRVCVKIYSRERDLKRENVNSRNMKNHIAV